MALRGGKVDRPVAETVAGIYLSISLKKVLDEPYATKLGAPMHQRKVSQVSSTRHLRILSGSNGAGLTGHPAPGSGPRERTESVLPPEGPPHRPAGYAGCIEACSEPSRKSAKSVNKPIDLVWLTSVADVQTQRQNLQSPLESRYAWLRFPSEAAQVETVASPNQSPRSEQG